jgi:hypothetical protein
MKTLTIIILTAILTACGGGEVEPVAEGVKCANVTKAGVPDGWCANGSDTVHLGKPNS